MKLNFTIFFGLFFLISGAAFAQTTVTGKLIDSTSKETLIGAKVTLESTTDKSITLNALTTPSGNFTFPAVQPGTYRFTLSYIGYDPMTRQVTVATTPLNLGTIAAQAASKNLREVTVTAKAPIATVKGDTTSFNARTYKTNPNANSEELVRKLPGVTVENGTVKAQGEDVQRVTVDGREFFGQDATLALRNLPAEVVDRVEVYNRQSDQARFSGFDDGQTTKTINIVTKPENQNGQFGKVFGGYGTDSKYIGGGNINWFNKDQRLAIIGLSNNINQQNFASQDLLGVLGNAGGQRRGGGGNFRGGQGGGGFQGGGGGNFRGGFQGGGGAGNFLVGQQSGITTTNALGLNYSDNFGKKTVFTGSYFFNNSNNANNQLINRDYLTSGLADQLYTENNATDSRNYNHRFNLRLEHNFDIKNQLIITSNANFQNNNSGNSTAGSTLGSQNALLNSTTNRFDKHTAGNSISGEVLYL